MQTKLTISCRHSHAPYPTASAPTPPRVHQPANAVFASCTGSNAIYLNTTLKKGISSIRLAKYLDITQKTTWFMLQRIRYSVEADGTYVDGKKHEGMRSRGASGKTPVVGIAERKGEIRLAVTQATTARSLEKVITDNVTPGSAVMTDEYRLYNHVTRLDYDHHRVNYSSKEFAVDQNHTNTIENT